MNEEKVPEIHITLKEVEVKAKTYKLKSQWYLVNKNGTHLMTKHWLVYMFYKIWWTIHPPKLECYCYYDVDVEKELEEMIVKQIEKDKQ